MVLKTKRIGACLLVLTLLVGASWGMAPARLGIVLAEDDPWAQNPANGHFYRLTDGMPWLDAEAQAVEWGGHLVTINDPEEELWLQEQFYPPDLRAGFWIGLNDIQTESNWVWSSGQTPDYENWCPGEPNDDDGEDAANMEGYPYDEPTQYCWNDNPDSVHRRGIVEKMRLIDIKPGSDPNSINLGSKGVVPVAVLTTEGFDASSVDPATVLFAGAAPLRWAMEDVDYDGDLDLIFHFKTQELGLDMSSTEATLTGQTFDGIPIEGTDTVNIVP
jgi:hypothetical protein